MANDKEKDGTELENQCSELANDPDILGRFAADLRACGLAGERDNAKLLFLIFYTRLFDLPVSAIIKGDSSGGKSKLLNTVLRFIPENAYEVMTSMSEKAIAYWDADLEHKHIVVQEAAGLQGEKGNALLRSLLTEGKLRHVVTTRDSDGQPSTQVYERDGPTALVMTTTSNSLYFEDETRMLSIGVNDSPQQTRDVLREMARGVSESDFDHSKWHALGEFIAQGNHRVVIPFSGELGELVDNSTTRMKRDFGHVLALTKANAVLHQLNRRVDGSERIVAEIEDYRVVYGLVRAIISTGVKASVPEVVRKTVDAVDRLYNASSSIPEILAKKVPEGEIYPGVPLYEVAKELKVSDSTASRSVYRAIRAEYIRNIGRGKGHPLQLVPNDPMPDDREVLPTPEEVEEAWRSREAA